MSEYGTKKSFPEDTTGLGEYSTEQLNKELIDRGDTGKLSDGYHTFDELYRYRLLYNAAFFNMAHFTEQSGLTAGWGIHKSKKHSDGEDCFGGGWFIVIAYLPNAGQISNHYEMKDWDKFDIPERETADEWDGHTAEEAAKRLEKWIGQ